MHKLRRVDPEDRQRLHRELREFARQLRDKHPVKKVYLYGSFARGDVNEGSDIDLIIVGDFEGKMHQRIERILDLTSLPVEPLVYTEVEFEEMRRRPFLQEVLGTAEEL